MAGLVELVGLEVLGEMLEESEIKGEPVAYALVSALKEFIEGGGRLSELSWFDGLNFGVWERNKAQAA
jgi:hypothetical protein